MRVSNIKFYLIFPIISTTIYSCSLNSTRSRENAINEILASEKAFADSTKKIGMRKAFLLFADDQAVIQRNDKIIKGKKDIEEYLNSITLRDINLEWSPDFVEVSQSGDLGYSYGKYTFEAINSDNDTISSSGIFHTVWKKQPDGSWKYVYD